MNDLVASALDVLKGFGYDINRFEKDDQSVATFEDETTLGFVFSYSNVETLCARWEADVTKAAAGSRLGLRRSGQKAWNVYAVFLTQSPSNEETQIRLSLIEENLAGTRKIARSNIVDITEVREALLVLIPLQSAPMLEAVDMPDEIRLRTSELADRAIEAFLARSDSTLVLEMLEADK